MKIKVWVAIETSFFPDEGEYYIDKVQVFTTKEQAQATNLIHIHKAELDLGSLITGSDIKFTV